MGSAPDPAGGPYSAIPDPLAGFKGSYFKGEGKERGKRGERGRGSGVEGKGEEGRGRGRWEGIAPHLSEILNTPLGDGRGGVGMEAEKRGGEGKGPCLDVFQKY